jgi:adenylate cyclase
VATSSDTPSANPTRELAAIMFSDIVGYTAIMGRDEQEGIRALAAHRALLRSLLPKFNGRMLGEIGDGTLSSFHSAVDAVNCARELQTTLKDDPELRLRIGIHVGDVLFSDNNVHGDGVNVASRIHGLAPPGGVYISERVYDEIRNQPEIRAKDMGEKWLKNVTRPIRVYALAATTLSEQPRTEARWIRRALAAGVAAVLIAALGYGVARWRSSAASSASQPATQARVIRSIAVLPLDNFSGDPSQEYFADGMTDELTTDLAKISALRVISRSSVMQFKGANRKPPPEIAKMLNVDAVVEGSVMRIGDRVRITAQLIDAPADKHLWADSYERDSRDVMALQDDLASAIARQINIELTPDEQARLGNARPVNPQAHEAYLKGRYFLSSYTREGVADAIQQFELAIKADPTFAPPYSGLADAYTYGEDWYFPATEVMPKAKAAAEKALQLDSTLAEAKVSLAFIKWQYDFDWVGGESEFRQAIALNPNYAEAHHLFGFPLAFQGRFDDGLAELKRASELDPLSAGITNDVGLPLTLEAKYDAAKQQSRSALELDPTFYWAQFCLGWADIEAGKFNQAIPELEKARAMDSPPFVAGWLGYAYAMTGEHNKARAIIADLNQMSSQISPRRFVSPFCTAIVYLGLKEKERALDGLEKAYAVRSQWLTQLKVDKVFDPLRSEPRFIALLKKVGIDK